MKLVVIKPELDKFDEAKELLERELTPKERTWLILADVLLRKEKKRGSMQRLSTRAA